ncbi:MULTISPECIES: transposase [Exiguobacterium]|uniref:transposase n=1 Tax=Exiguobacterium TaxID=33986 RepID=UPI0025C0F45A|nr:MULTISPECIES: transposase [Exiguobacterium]
MNEIHLSVKGIYGYRRVTLKNLKHRFGRNVNAKRVRRLMHVASIHCVIRRKILCTFVIALKRPPRTF